MPDSIAVLHRLGVNVPCDAGFDFRGIRFSDAHSSVTADFPNGVGTGVRRLLLHELLLQRAREVGVTCFWGAKRVQLMGKQVNVDGRTLTSDLLVAADGHNSSIRRLCRLHEVVRERRRYGFRRHFRIPPWSPYVELHWGRNCQIYVTPVAAEEVCIASLSSTPDIRLRDALAQFPEVRQRLAGAECVSREMGGVSVSRKLRRVCRDDIALVGDASGSLDAITGEGLCLSFKQALALAESVESGNLYEYQPRHEKLGRRARCMNHLLLMLDAHPRLRHRAMRSLASCPDVFSSLLSLHVERGAMRDLLSWQTFNFGRKFLAPDHRQLPSLDSEIV